ncbi:MAG: hypothetical protein ACR2MQ_02390 [Gemmatimonadaceae bacterium]
MSAINIRQSLVMVFAVGAAAALAACGHDGGSQAASDSSSVHATASAGAVDSTSIQPMGPSASASEAARLAPPPTVTLVTALGAAEQDAMDGLPAGGGRELVLGNCLVCHAASMIEQQHKDSVGWNKTVSQMMEWGAPVQASQKPALIAYLAQHFPARAAGPPARPVP